MDILVIDIATLRALMRTETIPTKYNGINNLGRHSVTYLSLNSLFWDHKIGSTLTLMLTENRLSKEFDTRPLTIFRELYYRLLRKYGINFIDIYKIMQPVKIGNSNRTTMNIRPIAREKIGHTKLIHPTPMFTRTGCEFYFDPFNFKY